MSRRLVRDVSWLWAGYVGRSLAYLGVTILLTHNLGPDGFGELSLFMALGLGVATLAGSWPFMAVPILAGKGHPIGAIFPPAARLAAVGTLASLLVALPLAALVVDPSADLVILVSIYAVALVGFQGLYGILQAEGRMRAIASVQTGERVLALAVFVGIVLSSSLEVRTAETTLAMAAVAACALGYLTLVKRSDVVASVEERLDWHTVFRTIGAMAIVTAAGYGVAWVDIYTLAAFKPDSDVGIYSLAYQIYTFVLQLASLWIVATLPRHARSFHAGVSAADQMPREKVLMGVRVWASLVGLGAVAAAIALTAVFGDSFADSTQPLLVLLAGASFLAPYLAVVSVLIGAGQSPLLARVSIVCIAVNLGVDLALIPTVGLIGPAVATTAQAAVGTVWLLAHTLGRQRLLEILRANAPVAVAIAVLAIAPESAPLIVLTGVIAVLTALPAINWLRENGLGLEPGGAESPLIP